MGKLGGRQLRLIPLKSAMGSYDEAEAIFQEKANRAAKKASARWERLRSTTEGAYVKQVTALEQHSDRISADAQEKVAEQMQLDTATSRDLIDRADRELDLRLGAARAGDRKLSRAVRAGGA